MTGSFWYGSGPAAQNRKDLDPTYVKYRIRYHTCTGMYFSYLNSVLDADSLNSNPYPDQHILLNQNPGQDFKKFTF
jgi:hypothetical protein